MAFTFKVPDSYGRSIWTAVMISGCIISLRTWDTVIPNINADKRNLFFFIFYSVNIIYKLYVCIISTTILSYLLFHRLARSTDWPAEEKFTASMPAFDKDGGKVLVILEIPKGTRHVPARSCRELRTDTAVVKDIRSTENKPHEWEKIYFIDNGMIRTTKKGKTIHSKELNEKWWENYGEGICCSFCPAAANQESGNTAEQRKPTDIS